MRKFRTICGLVALSAVSMAVGRASRPTVPKLSPGWYYVFDEATLTGGIWHTIPNRRAPSGDFEGIEIKGVTPGAVVGGMLEISPDVGGPAIKLPQAEGAK